MRRKERGFIIFLKHIGIVEYAWHEVQSLTDPPYQNM